MDTVSASGHCALSDADLAELLSWILTTMSDDQLDENFQHYTEQEIARYR